MMNTPIPTVAIVILKQNSVLLVKHLKGAGHPTNTYGLPAGKLESDETEQEAAQRELVEETGLLGSNFFKLPTVHTATLHTKKGEKTYSMVSFLCKEHSGELKDSDETAPEWVNVESLDELDLVADNVKEVIKEASNF